MYYTSSRTHVDPFLKRVYVDLYCTLCQKEMFMFTFASQWCEKRWIKCGNQRCTGKTWSKLVYERRITDNES